MLVERVDKLTPKAEWKRGYDEINAFEATLVAAGTRIVKLFLHTTQAEQDRRLLERLQTPYKRWKTGLEDYHNRSMRAEYYKAYEDMFDRTQHRCRAVDGDRRRRQEARAAGGHRGGGRCARGRRRSRLSRDRARVACGRRGSAGRDA